jgi:phospholipase A1
MTGRFLRLLALALLISPLSIVAGGLDDRLLSCARIEDDTARLACFDRLAAGSGAVPASTLESLAPSPVVDAPEKAVVQTKPADEPEPSSKKMAAKQGNWLGIRPYRRNYILPVTYNQRPNRDPALVDAAGFTPDKVEMKFQLSFELPVWEDLLVDDLDLYFAYTQLSFFQAYNTRYSSPFRDTAYEPELGLHWHPGLSWVGWDLESLRLALNHQSNGRTDPLSRSWNRVIGQVEVNRDDLGLGLRVWGRLGEPSDEDDNPDVIDYLGYGELFASYERGDHRYGVMLRNPFDYPAVQLDWSYLLTDNVRLYLQYFNGYGESLIDYDRRVNRVGVGFSFSEWP